MKTTPFAVLASLAVISASPAAPRLVVSTTQLAPESKIDLVLDSPVIESNEIGKTVDNTWLLIEPALPGKLRWKAQNIAELILDQPPALGTTYTFGVPEKLKHLDSSPVPSGKITSLTTESFRVLTANSPNRWTSGYSASTASWMIVFNDTTDLSTAATQFVFTSKLGMRIRGKLAHPSLEKAGYYATQYQPWPNRWKGSPKPNTTPESLATHIITVTPETPLPPSEAWTLVIANNLPNQAGNAKTTEDFRYDIGRIEEFATGNITADTTPNEGRSIAIQFNHPLPAKLPEGLLGQCITLQPKPKQLTAQASDNTITLTGSFEEQDTYQINVRNMASRDGFPLRDTSKQLTFKRLTPIIAVPSEDQGQLAHGTRKYRLFTQNLQSAHLKIKKLGGTDLIRAFQGFRNFTGNGPDHDNIQRTAPVPYAMVVGKSVYDKDITLGSGIDTNKILTLDWNEILPKEIRSGVLFLEATGKPHKLCHNREIQTTQAVIQLTDIGLAWKLTTKEALVYAFSCQTGTPLPGVKFELFGEDATSLLTATSDAAGLATLPRNGAARHLQASLGEDTYVTAFDASLTTVGLWHFPVRYSWNTPPETTRKAFLFTDRSLYRPGETVRLKGVIRTLRGNAIEPGKHGAARLIITDPAEKEILTRPVTLSANGSFDFTHKLAPETTGTHMIRLEFTDELAAAREAENHEGSEEEGDGEEGGLSWTERENIMENAVFEIPLCVEEFRRNAFEVTQTIATPGIGASRVDATLSAKYYQGQPVAAGKVKFYSRVSTSNPYPERFRDFLFGNHRTYDYGYWYHYFGYRDDEFEQSAGTTPADGETTLAADGSATVPVVIPPVDFPSPRQVTVSSEVTDANNQTLTARTTAVVHPSSVYVGVSRNDSLSVTGKPFAWKVVAVDPTEKPFDKPLKLTATVTREVHSTVRTQSNQGASTTRDDTTEETLTTTEFTLDPAASAKDGQDFSFTPKSNGLHYLTLRGTDPEGRPFATCTHFYVYGTTEYPWLYEDGLRIKLIAEKKSYKPGETARILVLSPIEGTALVTVEREKVLRTFQVALKADKPVIEVPLTDADSPNAYVSVLIVKGASDSAREFKQPQLRLGICELLVEERQNKLAVTLDTGAESYRPGEQVPLTGTVTLADGKPAANAEITLYAEDEGTLAVMGYETPDPLEYFYHPRNLAVDAGTSFESFIAENPELQTFNLKGLTVGGGGDWSKLADQLRKNFDPCATWAPTLVADSAGRFSHTFQLPDTLTRYRVIAIAHHGAAKFGHAETAVIAKKDLMLEPKAPRFANQSDTFIPQVLVQNASKTEGTWRVDYAAHNASGTPVCTAIGEASQTITLAPGASGTLRFPTVAATVGEAVLSWKATPVSLKQTPLTPQLSARLSDAVESRFQVSYPMPLIRQSKLVKLDRPGQMGDLRKALDAALLDGTGTLDLELARSPLVDAGGSVDFLLHYPYGCVEQTTSSLIPWTAVENLRGVIPSFAKVPEARVKSALQAGADRLLSMQLADGGFSYWPGDTKPVDWATPYAGLGLMLASQAGASVPETSLTNLKQRLIADLRGLSETTGTYQLEIHARALLVLAMAGAPQEAYQNTLVDRLPELTGSARAMLAAAIAKSANGDPKKLQTARDVLTSKVTAAKRNEYYWMPWTEDRALELIAWTMIEPTGAETTATLDRLLRDRNPYGHWNTTWVNGWSIVALGLYAGHEKTTATDVTLTLEAADNTETIRLTADSPTVARHFALAPGLKLGVAADATAYARIHLAAKPAIAPIQPVATNGLSVDRTYEIVQPDGKIVPLTEPRVGDLIRVSLRVTMPKDDSRYLVVEDMLPASFETVNSDFESQSSAQGVRTSENSWTVSHSELRTDRAVFFFDHIPTRGTYTITYLARCTVAGQTTAPPAKVESMYDPSNFALSASRVFKAD